nr:ulp1 protease family, C-terminal catalytic domain-containing protein [Tanacetum cinerariifolium]
MVEQPMSSHPVTSEPAKPEQTQEERYTERLDAVKYRPKYYRDSVERFAKCKNRVISIVPPKDMYVGPWEEWIEYEAILDLHINTKIDITCIHWWAMRLHLMTSTETSTEFMQRFLRLAGFLGAAAGTEEEQAKNFQGVVIGISRPLNRVVTGTTVIITTVMGKTGEVVVTTIAATTTTLATIS